MSATAALVFAGLAVVTAAPALAAGSTTAADPDVISSPDAGDVAKFWIGDDSLPHYSVLHDGNVVVEDSLLGFTTTAADFSEGVELLATPTVTTVDRTWVDNLGAQKVVPEKHAQYTASLKTKANDFAFDVVFRVSDEGVAFKYVFPQKSGTSFTISQETTQFNLVNSANAWVHTTSQQTAPKKTAVSAMTSTAATYARPLTVVGTGYAATITEANQLDYTRMFLKPTGTAGTLKAHLDGATGTDSTLTAYRLTPATVDVSASAFSTPWRVVLTGDDEGELVENGHLLKTLSPAPDPAIFPTTSWIQAGTNVRPMQLNTAAAQGVVDTMVARKIDYLAVDAGWYGSEYDYASDPWTPIAGFDPEAIADYAEARGKKVILYINWRALLTQYNNGMLDDLFAMYADEWGIDGLKLGFVPVGSQKTTKMVYDWVRLAAQQQLVINIHDEMLTTGLERTFPNILTMEGIRGDEEAPTPAVDIKSLFTRGVVGTADHTWSDRNITIPVAGLGGHYEEGPNPRSFRFAAPIAFFSALTTLYWYDTPASMKESREQWEDLPTTWDTTVVLESKIESHATVARKSGDEWWVASLTNGARTATIPLSFLSSGVDYRAAIVESDPTNVSAGVVANEAIVDSASVLRPALPAGTGYTVRLTPVKSLAEGITPTQSSTYKTGAASRATDGNPDGVYANGSVSHTNDTAQPWWQVDLGAVTPVTNVEVANRTDGGWGTRLSNYWVFVSDTPFNTAQTPGQQAAAADWSTHQTVAAGSPSSFSLPAGVAGRYVMVRLDGSGILSLAEVSVHGPRAVNLAAGAVASQSTTYNSNAASKAIDGDDNGDWAGGSISHTDPSATTAPWWRADLGAVKPLSSIELFNRTDGGWGSRLSDYYVFVSDTPLDASASAATLQAAADWSTHASKRASSPSTFTLPSGTTGRYVLVRLASPGILSLAEVKIWGAPLSI
ncbi:glycoside hydrolase family 97 N-terminal domain-containing protein [Microbacterium sulfonylureivorans]|uniref:glycoside hydrolase family 97 N-terminal domain-containing protein n=1 Tax=Microbacterium sulfonylureivorans TaxID=2486854 RepID=UPI0013DF3FE8|nr:glycoside hydrolase family 97 N-terminal domain-containing protein [Microbacterium sulfonylureivorans]